VEEKGIGCLHTIELVSIGEMRNNIVDVVVDT
jgi:hypothetical protein